METPKPTKDNPTDVQTGNIENIKNVIYEIRGQKVMLDRDLASIYGVETRALNQAVKRNADRFPEDFMFKLSKEEWIEIERISSISSQNVMTSHSNKLISPVGLIRVLPKCLYAKSVHSRPRGVRIMKPS